MKERRLCCVRRDGTDVRQVIPADSITKEQFLELLRVLRTSGDYVAVLIS